METKPDEPIVPEENTAQSQAEPQLHAEFASLVHPVLVTHRFTRNQRFAIGGAVAGVLLSIFAITVYLLLLQQGSFGQVTLASVPITRGQSQASQIEAVNHRLESFRFAVVDKDGKRTEYKPFDAGINFDTDQSVANARIAKERGSLWQRFNWRNKQAIPLEISTDKLVMDAFIDEKLTQIIEKPTNATLTVEGEEVKLTPEKSGNGYALVDPRGSLTRIATAAHSTTLTMTPQTIPATIPLKDIEPFKAQIMAAMERSIKFTIGGRTYSPSKETIGSWVEPITADSKADSLLYNSGEIEAYLDRIATRHTTPMRAQVTMTQGDGITVVLVRGRDGTDVTNKPEVAKDVAHKLLSSQQINIDLAISQTAHTTVAAESYDKWLLADLTNKRIYAYEKGVLVNSFYVSAGAPATPTVLGEYRIFSKNTKQDMRGYNVDGTTYFQPDVQWNMYFYGNYAIHGNYWRPADWFGRVNSSHGCIGLQNHNAKWIYDWAPIGTPVITHL